MKKVICVFTKNNSKKFKFFNHRLAMENIKDTEIFRFSETNTRVEILKVLNSSTFIDKPIDKKKMREL